VSLVADPDFGPWETYQLTQLCSGLACRDLVVSKEEVMCRSRSSLDAAVGLKEEVPVVWRGDSAIDPGSW
jgi:hypothetical protein